MANIVPRVLMKTGYELLSRRCTKTKIIGLVMIMIAAGLHLYPAFRSDV
jgi:hypothetical protein